MWVNLIYPGGSLIRDPNLVSRQKSYYVGLESKNYDPDRILGVKTNCLLKHEDSLVGNTCFIIFMPPGTVVCIVRGVSNV